MRLFCSWRKVSRVWGIRAMGKCQFRGVGEIGFPPSRELRGRDMCEGNKIPRLHFAVLGMTFGG